MRASDFFSLPSLKVVTEEGEKRIPPQMQSELQWTQLYQKLFTAPKHAETAIQGELQMERMRADLEARGLIQQKSIEKNNIRAV